MKSDMGRMPYVDIIYAKADDETKKNLKLAAVAFWQCHAKEKFEENFVKSQEKRHRQLYCYGNCPKVDEFEVSIKYVNWILFIFRHVSNRRYTQPTGAKFASRMSQEPGMDGSSIRSSWTKTPSRSQNRHKRSKNGQVVRSAGPNSVTKTPNTKFACKLVHLKTATKIPIINEIFRTVFYCKQTWIVLETHFENSFS